EKAGAAMTKVTTRTGVALKAISSRYETLRAKKLIPEHLVATASISKPLRNASKIALIREWLGWVDTYAHETNDSSQSIHYSFEGYRALYQAGFQDEALALMKRLAMSHSSSKFAIPSASLVVDTWIARKRWDQVEEEA